METLEIKGFFQFEIIMNGLVSSFCFIWIPCYGSTAIMHILHTYLSVRRSTLDVVFRRQVLRSKDGPRTERIKPTVGQHFVFAGRAFERATITSKIFLKKNWI